MMEIGQPKETELSELDDKTRRLRQKRMWSVKEKRAEPKALWDARSRTAGALRKPQTWREERAGRTPEETAAKHFANRLELENAENALRDLWATITRLATHRGGLEKAPR